MPGLVPPVVAYHLLGKSGAILIMVMVLMAVTSTGSSEIMAVTSIIIYDIYALNLKQYVACATREATLEVAHFIRINEKPTPATQSAHEAIRHCLVLPQPKYRPLV
ncbi:hypothetical protein RRG08_000319 [Elysia crispata]|uniref:Uncharacterized protein n=1 Tax=Elysia crispata TaxID=231223 RepID=A0AAE1BD68_9GAST|nr:hypothetical protein RRG08_000319 [Elysia crispata]